MTKTISDSIRAITVKDIPAILAVVPANRAVFLWGPPGIGKTAGVVAFAEDEELDLHVQILAQTDPVDIQGFLRPDGTIHTPKWWIRFCKEDSKGIIFFDELPNAAPSVQVAAYRLIQERRNGDHKLGEAVRILAAGNRREDRAGVKELPSPLRNRFAHFDIRPDLETWEEWATSGDIVDLRVVNFLRKIRPGLLYSFDPKKNDREYPTPRTWHAVSDCLRSPRWNPRLQFPIIAGLIGEGPATEFSGYLRVCDQIPDPEDILSNPEKAPIPEDPSARWAIEGALIGALRRNGSKDRVCAAMRYAARLEPEYAVLLGRDIFRDPKLRKSATGTKEFSKFVKTHGRFALPGYED